MDLQSRFSCRRTRAQKILRGRTNDLLFPARSAVQRMGDGCRTRSTGERGTSVPHVPRLNRTNLRFCKSYCCTVLFSLFNTVPNIVSLVRSGFLPVSVCFFQNSDLRNENSELSSDNQMRGQIDLGTDSYRSTYSAQVDSHLQRDSYANFKNDQFGIDSY